MNENKYWKGREEGNKLEENRLKRPLSFSGFSPSQSHLSPSGWRQGCGPAAGSGKPLHRAIEAKNLADAFGILGREGSV